MRRPRGQQIVRANQIRTVTKSPAFVSLYINDLQSIVSPWDFRLLLGLMQGFADGKSGAVLVDLIGELRMSPPFAKKVVAVLSRQVESYEETYGSIVDLDVL